MNTLEFSSNIIGRGLYQAMIIFSLYEHLHRNSAVCKGVYLCFWTRHTIIHFHLVCFIPTATV